MAPDATCTDEGPFFPLTARYAVQNGMALDDQILKSPDWVIICVLLAAVFLVIILLIIALVNSIVFVLIPIVIILVTGH